MPVSVRIEGLSSIIGKLDKLADGEGILRRGLTKAALELRGDIAQDLRVATGRLRASWVAAQPRMELGERTKVSIGTNVQYAPYVGDRSTPTGDRYGGKYVQKVIGQQAGKIVDIVRQEVREAMD